jgi:ribose/xylose/arabinose/galactoside ABC-type transport system permease subunit
LSLNAYSSELRLMLTGVILVLAVLFQRRFGKDR